MKTLILACFSCVTLTGVYFTLQQHRSSRQQLLSSNELATPVFRTKLIAAQYTPDEATKTEIAVSDMPTPEKTNAIATVTTTNHKPEVVKPIVTKPVKLAKRDEGNWFDYAATQPDATSEVKPAAPVMEPVAVTEEENGYSHVQTSEEEAVADPSLDARRLSLKLHPGAADSAARLAAPASVNARSIAHYTVATPADKMIVTHAAAVVTEERNKVTYVPSSLVTTQAEAGRESYSYTVLYDRAERIKAYAARKGYDTAFAFMIDMGMKSNRKRFFVMDLNTMTIVKRGMVAHGRGNSAFTFNKTYSNTTGSNCTSLGIYKVGAAYKGSYGNSFRLSGLESTNNNATKRSIILHGLGCIPYEESEYPICQSEGCPSLAPAFLREISTIIGSRSKPMLLWIYDPMAEDIEDPVVANY